MNYSALAPLYDRIMSHVGYSRWLFLIENVLHTYGTSKTPVIFEIGGGTGVLGSECREAGYSYIGSDLSAAMCKEAQKKSLPFFCSDARKLALKSDVRFDIVLFLYDGINYLMSTNDWASVFHEVWSHLQTDGLFLFDVTTLYNSKINFNEYVDSDDFGDAFYLRRSYYNISASKQHNDFTIFTAKDSSRQTFYKTIEHHEQKVLDIKDISDMIPDSLFQVLGIWDNFSMKKYTPKSDRVHFLLRRKEPT